MRLRSPAPALLAALVLTSCTALHTVHRPEIAGAGRAPATRFTRFAAPGGQPVFGYTTLDHRFHRLPGVAHLEGDTLVLERPASFATGVSAGEPALTVRIAVADLESVRATGVGVTQTVLAVAAIAFFATTMWFVSALARGD